MANRAPFIGSPFGSQIFGMHDRLRADYDGARDSRFRRRRTGVSGTGRSADYHYRQEGDYLKLMELARDLDRNEPVIGQLLNRAADNIVQQGFTLTPCTPDEAFNDEVKLAWQEWSSDPEQCDEAGEFTFAYREWINTRQTLLDGDVFDLAMASGRLSGVEAHRCRKPSGSRDKSVIHGVKLGKYRRRLQYWFTKDDLGPLDQLKNMDEVTPIDARNSQGQRQVFHVYRPHRYSQTRGVTSLAPVFDYLGVGGDLVFATLVRHLIANCVVFLRQKNADFSEAGESPATGEVSTQELSDGSSRVLQGIAPGMDIEARKGETISGFSPGLGDPQFEPLLFYVLSVVGANLGMPLIMVLLDFTKSTFSGWRGAMDQAKLGFRNRQKMLVDRYHTPVYRWKLGHFLDNSPALRKRAKALGPAAYWHTWQPPSWPYIEPLKDAGADLLLESNGMSSMRRIQAEKGIDNDDLQDEIIADRVKGIRKAKTAASALNAEFSGEDPVHWRELLPLPVSEGVKVNITAGGDEPAAAGDGARDKGQGKTKSKAGGQ